MADQVIERPEKPVRSKRRSIGRWWIGDSLGQGAYSWVKKGHDKRTNKTVALKFMSKADATWVEEQKTQVMTEIDALRSVKHPNVLRLYAYNVDAKYPERNGTKSEVILLVLEYADGGELFDVLYYTSHLEATLARTYFVQLIHGLAACHAAGVSHRDIKPQNLLLDSKFNLKIADFGLAKVFEMDDASDSGSDCSSEKSASPAAKSKLMHTTYVGTTGYQAPEMLLRRPFGIGCDVFSAGVVLFVLLNGYPPFNEARENDKWYKYIATERPHRFWDKHVNSPVVRSGNTDAQDLIVRMLAFDPQRRISLEEVQQHPFFCGTTLSGRDLVSALRARHQQARLAKMAASSNQQAANNAIAPNYPYAPKNRPLEQQREIRPRESFDSGVDCVHLTDWLSDRPYEEIFDTVWSCVEKRGHVKFANNLTSTLKVTMRACGRDNPSSQFVMKMFVKFFERSDGQTLIRMERASGDCFVFNGIREMCETEWRMLLC